MIFRIRIAQFPDPRSAPDLRDWRRPAPFRRTPSRRPHGSMSFRSFAAVNGLRPPEAARETRAIDSRKTSEKRGFHEVDGAPCRTRRDKKGTEGASPHSGRFVGAAVGRAGSGVSTFAERGASRRARSTPASTRDRRPARKILYLKGLACSPLTSFPPSARRGRRSPCASPR